MADLAELDKTRQNYRTKLAAALTDEDDPLAECERFVKWTIDSYPQEHIPKSGLLELLEEATQQFNDDAYKGDLRYLKLWILYAAYVDDERTNSAVPIYKYLVKNNIGMAHAHVYEEYAAALERADRPDDAKQVYYHGIKRKARPVERLKKRYAEFQARVAAKQPAPSRASTSSTSLPPPAAWKSATSEARAIRRDPLRKFKPQGSSATGSAAASTSASVTASASGPAPADTAASEVPPSLVDHPALTKHGHQRYLPMLLPTAPGKRPEKLRCNLSALFTEDGMEYSMQEVRARSMGLLGKKWAPPPPSELQRFSASSAQSNAGRPRNATVTRKGGFYAEPTVTLATKEALADVFDMYNSPEKSTRFGPAAGSKYAPVRRIEPVTPGGGTSLTSALAAAKRADENAKTPIAVFRDENAGVNAKTPIAVFRDENAGAGRNAKENGATPGAAKFSVFVDPSSSSQTPGTTREGRRALSAKEPTTPLSNENAHAGPRARPAASAAAPLNTVSEAAEEEEDEPTPPARPAEKKERPAFSVFTAAAATEPAAKPKPGLSKKDIFVDAPPQASSSKLPTPAAEQPFRVFSRPPSKAASSRHNENAPSRKPFTPFRDTSAAPDPPPPSALSSSLSTPAIPAELPPPRVPFGERSHTPLQPYSSASTDSLDADGEMQYQLPAQSEQYYDDGSTPSSDFDEVDGTEEAPSHAHAADMHAAYDDLTSSDVDEAMLDARTPGHSDAEDYDDEYAYAYEDPQPGSGRMHAGRLGTLNLMTPITERTLEYTSTRTLAARSTGGSVASAAGMYTIGEEAARESAHMLAAELHAEGAEDAEDAMEGQEEDQQHGLVDAIGRAASFAPPNPCNPFDAPIVAALLAVLPADHAFHDLRAHDSGRLDALQKFARRKERRSSGNSARGSGAGADEHALRVELADQRFDVVAKLGEGGFGAVFEAIDVNAAALKKGRDADDGSDDDFSDDDDDDEVPRVALKVVKPRSIWEFHVLRRIHATLSPALRRNIVAPAALYAYRDESFLVLELRRQGTLLDIVNRAPAAGITQQGACLDELLVMFFAVELMRTLEGLHRAGFIHGDVKIDNCLLRLEDVPGPASAWGAQYDAGGAGGWAHKGVTLIDFGRTIDTRLFPAGQAFVGDWATDARDCVELREGRPWTFQTDYFGLAGVIFCMLYGKYIEAASVVSAGAAPDGRTRYKLATPFKRYWQGELWTRLFDLLLNPTLVRPDASLPLCDEMAELRAEMEAWLAANCNRASNTLKGLLKKVGLSVLGGKDGR